MVIDIDAIGFSELQRLGVPLDLEVLDRMRTASCGLDIQISERFISEPEFGKTFLLIHALIFNLSLHRIRLDQCRVDIPWHDPDFRLLEDPSRKVPREGMYSLTREPSYTFDRDVVLNHRFGRNGWLNPGDFVDGMILGAGSKSITSHYEDRHVVDVKLLIWDGRGKLYLEKIPFMLDRLSELRRQKAVASNPRKRIPLFGEVFV